MSIGLGKGVGIPVKLMHESEGHVITVSTIYILSFCSGSFSRKEGSFWIFSRCHFCSSSTCSCSLVMKDAKEREEERRQRTRRVFLMLGMLFSSSSSSSERVFLRGCGPYKIAHWQTFFFLLLLLIRLNWNPANCTEGRWWKPRTTGTVSWRTCRTRRETVRVFTFVSFFIRRKVVRAGVRLFPREGALNRPSVRAWSGVLSIIVLIAFFVSLCLDRFSFPFSRIGDSC